MALASIGVTDKVAEPVVRDVGAQVWASWVEFFNNKKKKSRCYSCTFANNIKFHDFVGSGGRWVCVWGGGGGGVDIGVFNHCSLSVSLSLYVCLFVSVCECVCVLSLIHI